MPESTSEPIPDRGRPQRRDRQGRRPRRPWRVSLALAAAANLVAVGWVAAPGAAQAPPSLCAGTAQGLTIAGNLAVPAGQSCELVDSTVTGDVVVRDGGALVLDGSTVRGDLTVRTDGFLTATGAQVGGDTVLRRAFGGSVTDSTFDGDVTVRESTFFFSDDSTHGGSISSRAGQTLVTSGRVDGDLRTSQDQLTDLNDSVVTGELDIQGAPLGSVVCRSEVDGAARFRDNSGVLQIGPGRVADCSLNVFGDDVALRDNDADIEILGNVIRGDLACTGNEPPFGLQNRIRGEATGQCERFDAGPPPPPALGSTAAPELASRAAGVRELIEDRTATVAAQVASAGPAGLG